MLGYFVFVYLTLNEIYPNNDVLMFIYRQYKAQEIRRGA